MNNLIHLAKQMGLINQRFYNYLPNATVCKGNEPQIDNDHVRKWRKIVIEKSHEIQPTISPGLFKFHTLRHIAYRAIQK